MIIDLPYIIGYYINCVPLYSPIIPLFHVKIMNIGGEV